VLWPQNLVNQSLCNARGSRSGSKSNSSQIGKHVSSGQLLYLRHETTKIAHTHPYLHQPHHPPTSTVIGLKSDARFGLRVNLISHCPLTKRLIRWLRRRRAFKAAGCIDRAIGQEKRAVYTYQKTRKQITRGINLSINWLCGNKNNSENNKTIKKMQKYYAHTGT